MQTLLQKIGGPQILENILKSFYQKMLNDMMLSFLFKDKDIDHIISQQKDFLSKAFGGKNKYHGKSPTQAHKDLSILSGHFDRRIVLLKQTLEEFHLNEDVIQQWIQIENSFRKVVVKK